jgi:ElaA protein
MDSSPDWTIQTFAEFDTNTLYDVLALRQAIFVVEQNCPYQDLDGLDQAAFHMLCREGHTLLAYQRCLPPGTSYPESSIGRIIVSAAARGRQLGRELVQRGIDFNREQWPDADIRIGAQAHLADFYGSLGFELEGEEYVEDGIPHVHMVLAVER